MNKQILISLGLIAVVSTVVITGTVANLFDEEVSTGNTISAGVVDIVVDDQNPWTNSFSDELEDLKPGRTKYIEFIVRNVVASNPVKVWKHIDITEQIDGYITEPECSEGNGTWVGSEIACEEASLCCTGGYVPRNNLAAYIVYDMSICPMEDTEDCQTDGVGAPTGTDWTIIIAEDQHVRLDNVASAWIALGELQPGQQMKVVQSYHLGSWPDAPEPEVTNWAQGDKLIFNIELYAEQIGGYGPKGLNAMVTLDNKVPDTWELTDDGIGATLNYKTSASEFEYTLDGVVKEASTEYCLIYYADPYEGSGETGNAGLLIDTVMSDGLANVNKTNSVDLNSDLPQADDQNYPGGAKVWLVPCVDYNETLHELNAWNPDDYLFEIQFILYDDTDV